MFFCVVGPDDSLPDAYVTMTPTHRSQQVTSQPMPACTRTDTSLRNPTGTRTELGRVNRWKRLTPGKSLSSPVHPSTAIN